ncbi:methylated-DNA--[protein]-cysteine S-methyltransferase [Halalkalibacterium halodurans]|uniref:Methylated-DNA--protein-cysteine methyltransferase n=1 Tax=Halalkalibacterium halodurans (strain ATCC BAA-125 / DSM 18197 / FERM 7344 / JCM 9153 / C-125) TaxID=272558 RepID=Q9KFT4_HALH5|nr:methylated-DNA--[protein]-cysteine S-methyltransferase [Halalkalibacterium halodurans]MDY7220886.1 methylated-DNA--[protein]-cysteine S-methyltransferase [Halalkalibacterium halodurans]MDY7240125.1 methylated-DNA--[protein]-cysteine S-methyltransferase [Halalkalibacterium halodurans]MED4082558.1 methylated-DNA--[protein]-cysteine S-methyltransferase [Halalkalibacterium halodurans]MED4085803.1 methylated-DNA--[protein]-cysteine S-methyltransferase [Halalkalibacterium halodurans]MED4105669.1 
MNLYQDYYFSPIGPMEILASDTHVRHIRFSTTPSHQRPNEQTDHCIRELTDYFAGTLTQFTVSIHMRGTPFQQEVWKALASIPYGDTRTYQQIAALIGRENAYRAVGQAISHNPLALVIPCHRVVGKTGKLTGFAWGVERKKQLLDHEAQSRYVSLRNVFPSSFPSEK